jgi:hypothetical protein
MTHYVTKYSVTQSDMLCHIDLREKDTKLDDKYLGDEVEPVYI